MLSICATFIESRACLRPRTQLSLTRYRVSICSSSTCQQSLNYDSRFNTEPLDNAGLLYKKNRLSCANASSPWPMMVDSMLKRSRASLKHWYITMRPPHDRTMTVIAVSHLRGTSIVNTTRVSAVLASLTGSNCEQHHGIQSSSQHRFIGTSRIARAQTDRWAVGGPRSSLMRPWIAQDERPYCSTVTDASGRSEASCIN